MKAAPGESVMILSEARRILLCLRYGIGDVVMELPALETLRRAAPQAHLTALGSRHALQILEGDPRLDALACVQDWGLTHWGDPGTGESVERLEAWLQEQEFDLILDVSHAVIGVRDTLWARERGTVLDTVMNSPDPMLKKGKSGIEALNAIIYNSWGLEVPADLLPRIWLGAEESRFRETFLHRSGLEEGLVVGLSPVASSALKRWPETRLAALADRLVEEFEARLLLFCSPHDDSREVLGAMRHAGRVTVVLARHLRQTAALLTRCATFICNDTGLMHVAAAVGTPVVAVFGPTSPRLYLPPLPSCRAAGAETPCPHRKNNAFGPALCMVENRCLVDEKACIHHVELREVWIKVRQTLAAAAAAIR
ncbi:MAG: glycosyltransferase family 9 protein [Candidatus Zixiibacteriota bacterium]|nr:MAG: glycosyltransferase family 9 protein [candidate division Zixibacteria bacterium]